MDPLQNQKQLMVEQLNKFSKMDSILPLHQNEVENGKRQQIQLSSLNFRKLINGQQDKQLLNEIEEQKHDAFYSKHEQLKKYFTPFMAEQQVITQPQQGTNILEFNQSDFQVFQEIKERQRQLAQQDLTIAKQKESTNQIFEENLMKKWDRVRKKLRMIGRMKKLYDEVKLYGTSCRVETSIKRHEVIQELEQMLNKQNEQIHKPLPQKQNYILLPDSKFKKYWQYVLILLLLYTAFIIPIRVAFLDYQIISLSWIEQIINLLFLIDILIIFNAAFYNEEGLLITDRLNISITYLKTWFIFDLLAIIPTQIIFNDQDLINISQYIKLARLPRIYKLISIYRMWSSIQNPQKHNSDLLTSIQELINLNSTTIRVIKFFGTVLVCVHIMGCLWYFVAKENNFGPNTWVYELDLLNKSEYELYLTSIYWAVATICTVGFGDIHAFNDTERIVCIFWMFFGVGFYSFTVGSLSTLIGTLDTREAHLQSKITFMDEFCEETKLSLQMKHKIRKVLEYNSKINIFSSSEVDEFLKEIPTNLKYQIAQAMYQGLKSRVSFFKNKDSVFISTLIPKLQPIKINSGEFIYNKGEYPNQVYFIVNGRVNMVIGVYSIAFKTYVTGSYFGEIEIFDNSARFHSARAEIECELLAVEQDVFKKILQAFPEYYNEIKQISLEKLVKEKDAIEKLQDLTGLSQNSEFFHKRRTQSIYKSIKQRESVQFIDYSEESEQEIKSMRQSRVGITRKKTNHLLPDDGLMRTQTESQKQLNTNQTESPQKIITLNIPDKIQRESQFITLYGDNPKSISQFNEQKKSLKKISSNQKINLQLEDENIIKDTQNLIKSQGKLNNTAKEEKRSSIQQVGSIELIGMDAPLIASVSRKVKQKPSIKIDEVSHESDGSNKNSPHSVSHPLYQYQKIQSPANTPLRKKNSQKSIFIRQQQTNKIEQHKLKNIPRLGSYRRTYRKEKEIEVIEMTEENEDYSQLQHKLVQLLEKIKQYKAKHKFGNKSIQFSITNPQPPKRITLQEKDSLSIDNQEQNKNNSDNSSGILE